MQPKIFLRFIKSDMQNLVPIGSRLEQFLILEEANEEKKRAYLLTLIGGKAYDTLKNLCSPKLPREYKYEELIEKLVEYFSPRRSIIVERFMFFGRIQKETESVSEYLVEIKRLASTCGFGEFLKEFLRDKLVCGLRNAKIQRRILSEGDVPLARVVEIALSMEAAEKNTRIFHVNEPVDSVDKIRAEVRNRYDREQKRKCIHCGRLHKDLCRFREATCFRCGKRGHLATICRSHPYWVILLLSFLSSLISTFTTTPSSPYLISVIINPWCIFWGRARAGIPTLSTSRLQRWGLALAVYTYEIKFRRTQDHGNADLFSRLPVESDEKPVLNQTFILSYVEDLPVTAEEIGVETKKDEVLSVVKRYTQQGWPERVGEHLRPYFQRKLELTMDVECLLWGMRVILPSSLRKNMLSCLHETHSGMGKMKAVARSHFWWPNLDNQIECMVNGCKNYQQIRQAQVKLSGDRGWSDLLIVVDSHSKWVEAIPMREITARKTIEQLRRLFSAYGLPEEVVSDNGPQFTGVEMKSFFERNGVKHTLIPAYHPQSNGLAERAVKLIKMALEKNKRKFEDTILRERQARQMKYNRGKGQEEFEVDDQVWCKNFRGVGWIPGRIVGRKESRVYTVWINGQVNTYHRDQIRRRWTSGESGDEAREKREKEDDRIWMAPENMNSRRDRETFSSESAGLPQDPGSGDQGVEIESNPWESAYSSDKEARTEERLLPRRNPPRDRRPSRGKMV
ncbi:K02A2.6-like [Cordylochernes scorpioides]|uniref:RNA-directed DNA polymerase n=1 Tax=Cordylochernes scorpioides TaxID=51811 RepID=A0ABY6LM47_9ARAC|nr:K02A2.6-like [Cordylochernes scorpioides]